MPSPPHHQQQQRTRHDRPSITAAPSGPRRCGTAAEVVPGFQAGAAAAAPTRPARYGTNCGRKGSLPVNHVAPRDSAGFGMQRRAGPRPAHTVIA